MKLRFVKRAGVITTLFLLVGCSRGSASEAEVLNVYNSADYIDEDDKESGRKGIISLFEDYMKEKGRNVRVNYSTFDTNETMLGEMKTGKAQYDLVCPSDYVIQKMMAEDMIEPYDKDGTPDYDANVSPFVDEKMTEITVEYNGKTRSVRDFARGYMWGTLGILYNNRFASLSKDIDPKTMDQDMRDWNSLYTAKYKNLLAIKDSVRDTYAVGIFHHFDEELQALKATYDASEKTPEDQKAYNDAITKIFNRCDDNTINSIGKDLTQLKNNAFGFEVDSGKSDMARGANFAINIAWSGDASWAMDMADENNEKNAETANFVPTKLKYVLPDTGSNIWFDGWAMPKGANKELAQEFVNFISKPENAALNMDAIGYTPVIAGDAILSLVQSYYDIRYDEAAEAMNPALLDGKSLVKNEDIDDLDEESLENSYYQKDVSYFFKGTLSEHTDEDCIFDISAASKGTQFDTQYPDASVLPRLAVMADFGSQTANMLMMWENVKNTALPLWSYYVILGAVIALIGFGIYHVISRRAKIRRRKERHKAILAK